MTNPTCYLLIGPPCSGKSTYRSQHIAKAVLDGITTQVISSDDHIEERAAELGLTYSQAFARIDFKAITKALSRQISEGIAANHDLMIDRTNMTISARNKVLARLPRHYQRVGVIFDVPRRVLDERLIARAAATGKHIPASVIDDMIKSYQEPLSNEFNRIIRIEQ